MIKGIIMQRKQHELVVTTTMNTQDALLHSCAIFYLLSMLESNQMTSVAIILRLSVLASHTMYKLRIVPTCCIPLFLNVFECKNVSFLYTNLKVWVSKKMNTYVDQGCIKL